MPTFRYTAKTLRGEERQGTTQAENRFELSRLLREQGLLLLDATSAEPKKGGAAAIFERLKLFGGVSISEKMIFARYLSVMVASGVDLPRSLSVMARQTKSKRFQQALAAIGMSVARGTAFSDSLKAYPDIFPELFISMVEVGEESGRLDEVLQILAVQMEKDHTLRSRLRGALIYPVIVIMLMVVVGIFMFIFVVPTLKETFASFDAQLPITTKIVFALGDFSAAYWAVYPVAAFGFIIFLRVFLSQQFGKKTIATALLRLPIFSALVRKVASAQTSRTLASLITSAVPLVRALTITAGTVSNFYFAGSLRRVAELVQKGVPIHEALARDSKLWPPVVPELIAVGEETGKLGEVLAKLAEFYESEVDQTTKNLSSIVEPLLMVVIGLGVGFFAVSMLSPMYSLVGSIE